MKRPVTTPRSTYHHFQVEMYAIKLCVNENLQRNVLKYKFARVNKQHYTPTYHPKTSSKLVQKCQQNSKILVAKNKKMLKRNMGFKDIDENKKADEISRNGIQAPFVGLKLAFGISKAVVVRIMRVPTVNLSMGYSHGL